MSLYNWSGTNIICNKNQIIDCYSIDDIIRIFQNSANKKIRVIGSGLSYESLCSVYKENGILLRLNMIGIITTTETTATFWASSTLDYMFKYLTNINKMLKCSPGVIGIQTIAGAISTGTHGQGLYQSSLSDEICHLEIIKYNGEILNIYENDTNFGAYILSLGCLGIITKVTFKTQALKIYKCEKSCIDISTFKNEFVNINYKNEFCKAWWFPQINSNTTNYCVHLWKVNECSEDETNIYHLNGNNIVKNDDKENTLNNIIDNLRLKMAHDTKDTRFKGDQFLTIDRFENYEASLIGNLTQIYCKGIPVPQINCEIAFPLDKFTQVIMALEKWVIKHKNIYNLHYPFIFRTCGPSKAWLSPSYNKSTCYIGFLVYKASDGSFSKNSFEMMKSLQKLLSNFNGIPHLGKHMNIDIYKSNMRKYLKIEEFLKIKSKNDPQKVFENEYINNLFRTLSKNAIKIEK